jgi:YbbR domain-containing protein
MMNKKENVRQLFGVMKSEIKRFFGRVDLRGEAFLQSRLFLGCVALFISMLIWVFVAWDGNTDGTKTMSVQVQYNNLARGYSMSVKTGVVTVRLSGRINSLSRLEQGDVTAQVDLQGLQIGRYNLPIKIEVPPSVRVRNWEPAAAEVDIYRHVERTFPVAWRIDGPAPEGMIVSSVDVQPKEVILSGPESAVLSVQAVEAVIPSSKLAEASGDIRVPVSVLESDENSKYLDELTLSPQFVTVSLSMEQEMVGERIPVKVPVVGQPAEGLEIDSIKVMPDRVSVRGRSEVIRKMQSLTLSPVDISGLDQDLQLMLPLQSAKQDQNVEISGPDRVRVDIKLRKKMAVKAFSNVNVMVNGADSSKHEWKLTPSSVTLTIEGSQTAIEELHGGAPCELYVDVSNIVLKQIQLPVLVRNLKKDFQVVKIEPEQVTVTEVQ